MQLAIACRNQPNPNHPSYSEDAILVDQKRGLFGVFDGMGGHAAGEEASKIAKDTIAERENTEKTSEAELKNSLGQSLKEASRRIKIEAQKDPKKRGMGTTATILKLKKSKGFIAHAGDCRLYHLTHKELRKVTEEDDAISLAQQKGRLTKKASSSLREELSNACKKQDLGPQALSFFRRRNIIAQALGIGEIEPHLYTIHPTLQEKILLSSDGIHDNLTPKEIKKTITSNPPQAITNNLVKDALRRSQPPHFRAKPDDMSVICIQIQNSQ